MDGDVQQAADDVHVLRRAAVQTGRRQLQAAQLLLHVGRPLLHQVVDVGHGSAVLHAGRGLGAVQGTDALHPAVHGARIGLRTGHARHLLQLQDESGTDMNKRLELETVPLKLMASDKPRPLWSSVAHEHVYMCAGVYADVLVFLI